MSKIELYNGDCLEIMKDIKANSIDVIIADPPYWANFKGLKINIRIA